MSRDRAVENEIIGEIYRCLVLLGAKSDLLGTVGSWRDSLPDEEVLSGLKAWNQAKFDEVKGCIEHYEVSAPRSGYSHDAALQTSVEERRY